MMPSLTGMKMLIATKTYVLPLPTGTVVTDRKHQHTQGSSKGVSVLI